MNKPRKTPARLAIRCAVYTSPGGEAWNRNSTRSTPSEEDALKAYIKSQAQEGWQYLADKYDDGGFTGGNTDVTAASRITSERRLTGRRRRCLQSRLLVARPLALALRIDEQVRRGEMASFAEVAELGHVTRACVSQIMNMLNLAPDIQEAIPFLPRTVRGRDPLIVRELQPIASILDWA